MGATPLQIIRNVLVPEALPSITLGLTLVVVSLIGYVDALPRPVPLP